MRSGRSGPAGPTEAAYVINEMVKPVSVIPSHANEVATEGGKLIDGTKTDVFIKAVKVPAHLPLSGRTMEFDGKGSSSHPGLTGNGHRSIRHPVPGVGNPETGMRAMSGFVWP